MDLGTTSPYGMCRSAVVPVAALGHHEGAEPRSHRNYGGGGARDIAAVAAGA